MTHAKTLGLWAAAASALAFMLVHAGVPAIWVAAAVAAVAIIGVSWRALARARQDEAPHTLRFSRGLLALATIMIGILFLFDED